MFNKIAQFFRLLLSSVRLDYFYRLRGGLFLGISNIFPDLFFFAALRPIFWRLAGVKLPILGHCIIRKNVWVDFPSRLIMGEHVQINRGTVISAHGGVIIGTRTTLSHYVGVHSLSHSGKHHEKDVINPVIIGNHCMIYSHAVILPGTKLGDRSVVAAGAVTRGRISTDSLVVGNPARITKRRKD